MRNRLARSFSVCIFLPDKSRQRDVSQYTVHFHTLHIRRTITKYPPTRTLCKQIAHPFDSNTHTAYTVHIPIAHSPELWDSRSVIRNGDRNQFPIDIKSSAGSLLMSSSSSLWLCRCRVAQSQCRTECGISVCVLT